MNDPKYNSGSSLIRTNKEEEVDRLEAMLGEMPEEMYLDMKKLTVATLRQLRLLIQETLANR